MSENTLGQPVWYELMTSDPRAAQAYYTSVIGWGTQAMEGGPMPYTMWTRGGTPIGGVMELPEQARSMGAPPHWLMYVGTPSADETVAKATGLGARVYVPPTDVPGMGRFAVLADPAGAVFAVWQSTSGRAMPEAAPQRGDISWHELLTLNHDEAFAFYQSLFGWETIAVEDMGPMGFYRIFGRNGRQLGGMFNKTPEIPAPPHWLLYVSVENVHAAVASVKAHGGQVLNGPMEVPGGDWIAQCLDPQGAAFAVHQAAAAAV